MSQANLGWLFYKELYREGANDAHIKGTLAKLESVTKLDSHHMKFGAYGFTLKTIYPGLIIGSGYTHGISSDEDTKMGFYFDHTTGLPLIPGSSVKGVLRSLFGLAQKNQTERYKKQKEEFIKELVGDDTIDVDALANEIFEGIDDKTNKPLPMYKRDKFFDAVIVGVENGELMQEDYITPHKEPLKNPIPIKIIKIAPGVTFRFNFDFKDGLITANQKEDLALKLLQFSGIGAKTNVGYGQFEEWSEEELQKFKDRNKQKEISIQLESATSEFDKFKIKLGRITKPKPIYENIKKIADNLSPEEKEELKKIVDEKVSDKTLEWYKKSMKIL